MLVLDGELLGEEVQGAPPTDATRRWKALPVDSIFDLRFVTDSSELAGYGICPGKSAAVAVTMAESRRLGLRPPPPALCVRTTTSSAPPYVAFPVGEELQIAAGQLDILGECDREAPPDVRWSTTDSAVATVDSLGRVRAISPGPAEVVAHASGVGARFALTIVPRVVRIQIHPGDTTVHAGDTAWFRAVAIGADGHPVPGARVSMRATETRASYVATDTASRRLAGLREVHFFGSSARRSAPNELPVHARRASVGYVVAAVVGRVDSVRVEAVLPHPDR